MIGRPSPDILDEMALRRSHGRAIPIIDLFAGPGGLGEGFSAAKQDNGSPAFKIKLSVEMDRAARNTLALRAFFRQFRPDEAPDLYYSAISGKCHFGELAEAFPKQYLQAQDEAWQAELGKPSGKDIHKRITTALNKSDPWVLIGGPPCQAYSLIGRARRKGLQGYRPENDERNFLYRQYLDVIARHRPAVFVMENVKGLLSAAIREEGIFARMLEDLSSPTRVSRGRRAPGALRYHIVPLAPRSQDGSAPEDFVVHAERFGVPQERHRVILIGVRSDIGSSIRHLAPHARATTVQDVLKGLPAVRSGLSTTDCIEAWHSAIQLASKRPWYRQTGGGDRIGDVLREALNRVACARYDRGSDFIPGAFRPEAVSDWFLDRRLEGICNHRTRGHMTEDLHRYLFAACFAQVHRASPLLADFPRALLPKHLNLKRPPEKWPFKDRFTVQLSHLPSSTVTSHIHKDGHYYIHYDPYQVRSLTVREAARLQTFPDNYYFTGGQTQAFKQVGNAVPPLLAKQIAETVLERLR